MIKKLTNKEEEIMNLFWKHGAMFIRELLPYFNDPKPHYNTVATIVKIMEEKGFVARQPMGNTLLFYPLITEQEYKSSALDAVISQYYNNSYASVAIIQIQIDTISSCLYQNYTTNCWIKQQNKRT